MRIILAEHFGMCFGVRDAINLAFQQSQNQNLTILGDLVHNETVLADLRAKGIRIAQNVAGVETQSVMVTAHGASEVAMARARARGLEVLEATCPLVHAGSYCMAVAVMPFQRHGCGSHAVSLRHGRGFSGWRVSCDPCAAARCERACSLRY